MHFEFIFVYGVKKCSNLKNVDNSQIILKKKKVKWPCSVSGVWVEGLHAYPKNLESSVLPFPGQECPEKNLTHEER